MKNAIPSEAQPAVPTRGCIIIKFAHDEFKVWDLKAQRFAVSSSRGNREVFTTLDEARDVLGSYTGYNL